jgi:Flp pilus assembly protein TadB
MPIGIEQWERACAESLAEARQRRQEPRPGLMPHGSQWLGVLGLLALCAVMLAVYILLWAAQ